MAPRSFTDTRSLVDQLIAFIDEALNEQVNAILHHREFQAMEARWRGLAMIVREASRSDEVKVKLLNASWRELARNLEKATDFDQSQLFEIVYNREFGMPGGEPIGLLIGDYAFSPDTRDGVDCVTALSQIGMVAAAAFCPFIAAASPEAVGLQDFSEMSRVHDFSWLRQEKSRLRWNALRARDDSPLHRPRRPAHSVAIALSAFFATPQRSLPVPGTYRRGRHDTSVGQSSLRLRHGRRAKLHR